MATSPNSYLQTLPKDEAIAFAASLQRVKEHLNQELQWMSEQVQQKTNQLKGIETLLSEASTLGLLDADAASSSKPAATTTQASSAPSSAKEVGTNGNGSGTVAAANLQSSAAKDVAPAAQTKEPDVPKAASSPATAPARQARTGQKKTQSSKTQQKTKPTAAKQSSTAKTKSAKSSTPAAGNGSKSAGSSGYQPEIKSQFRDVPVMDAVGEILKQSKSALDADDIIEKLYDDVPEADYKRIKHSISNVLSLGKSKKRWKSTGRGMYAS